ncbi:hypothetical protein FDP41_001157 [Naegleria fowleri]|uniref:Homeobox domain-containing protein n=1 Tax=Naegleria fowleri TaxID=5763 RepID=A0A6A5C0A0_NAEFO|nr:uncharacterized protein FDP41_001157 [Naegleria fowleri]KAF0980004.1 hypothetical protein FDP41_001157 [Naegleria fowleri]CAG4710155.1 unnamed protein product [Naegleria fowleri]
MTTRTQFEITTNTTLPQQQQHQQNIPYSQQQSSNNTANRFVFSQNLGNTSTLQPLPSGNSLSNNTTNHQAMNQQQQLHNSQQSQLVSNSSSTFNNSFPQPNSNASNNGLPQGSNTTSIQMQFQQQLQQYQQRLFANNANQSQQQQPNSTQHNSMNGSGYPSTQVNPNIQEEELMDWINDGTTTRLLQQELPPFEDFEFGWFNQYEQDNQATATAAAQMLMSQQQQYMNGGNGNNGNTMNILMQPGTNGGQGMMNPNYALNALASNTIQVQQNSNNQFGVVTNGEEGLVTAQWNVTSGEQGEVNDPQNIPLVYDGLKNMTNPNNAVFGGMSSLYTNHTISTTESKGITSIAALANSLSFNSETSPQEKKGKRSKKMNVTSTNSAPTEYNTQQSQLGSSCQLNASSSSYDTFVDSQYEGQSILDLDEETLREYVYLLILGEKPPKKGSRSKSPAPFEEEDFSKLLDAKSRLCATFEQCRKDNMSVVNSFMSQYTPSLDINADDSLNNDMKELFSKVKLKLEMKNEANKRHCEQVLVRLLSEWISVAKFASRCSDRASSNDSSSNSKKKQRSTNRRLPNEAKKILENWFLEHYRHPYPTNEEKQWLSDQTQLNLTQINNWFINKRGRSLKVVKEKLKGEQNNSDSEE